MSIKQAKIVKIIRAVLVAIYLYFIWNKSQLNNNFETNIIAIVILVCSIALGEVLPKEYKFGNTFFSSNSTWLEFLLEITLIFALAWGLIHFL